MFVSHKHSGFNYIELYTLLQQTLPFQQSQIIDQFEPAYVILEEAEDVDLYEAEAEVDIVDDDEEESEMHIDYLLNTNTEDEDHQALMSPRHVYYPPQHMIKLNLDDNEPSSDIFYNPHMRLDGDLKVAERFCTKEECVRAIKKFHMENSVDYNIDRTLCRNVICMFRQVVS